MQRATTTGTSERERAVRHPLAPHQWWSSCSVAALFACAAGLTSCDATPPAPASTWTLAATVEIRVHDRPSDLAVFDLDEDGDLDVVVGGASISILRNDGAGGLAPVSIDPMTELVSAIDFAFGDFDGDGRTDIVVADHDAPGARFGLLLADGSGGYAAAPGSPFAVDATPHLHSVAALDADGDGALDVVADSWPQSRLVLVRGRGDGTFDLPGRQFAVPEAPMQNLRSGDLNGDGQLDIVTPAHDSASMTVMLGDGRGGFAHAAGSPFQTMGGFTTVELVDIDLDGDVDIVAVHRSDASTQYRTDGLSVLLNDGGGRFQHAEGSPHVRLPLRSNDVAIGDVDGDGRPDIVVLGETHRSLALLSNGSSGIVVEAEFVTGFDCRGVALADLDGDGRCEILVADHDEGVVRILE